MYIDVVVCVVVVWWCRCIDVVVQVRNDVVV